VFTDFYIAPRERARDLLDEERAADFELLSLDEVGEFELDALGELLLGKNPDSELAYEDRSEGVYVLVMDSALVNALAQIEPKRLAEIAKGWRDTSELEALSQREVQDLLAQLASFASKAEAQRQPLIYYTAV
jgi:hypothetical protein